MKRMFAILGVVLLVPWALLTAQDTVIKAQPIPTFSGPTAGTLRTISIPTVDISGDAWRHVFVARGTEQDYHGHCDTVLMVDGKTMFVAWCMNHAGHLGPLARSDDGGLTWTSPLPTPADWRTVKRTTPVLHRLTDPRGVERLFLFGGCDFPGNIRSSVSEDGGMTWSPTKELGLVGEVAPKSILPFDGGKKLIMWSDRRDLKNAKDPHPVVWQSESLDGGLTWSQERVILVVPGQWAQPSVTRSTDGRRLLLLMRENTRQHHSLYSISTDDARTWSEPQELPAALTGDRHVIKHAPDGRLVVAFRDMAKTSPTYGHYVAWVGTFEDIEHRREGQYRIKLLHNANRTPTDVPGTGNTDCGYSDLEMLGDGTLIATTYLKYAVGPEKSSVVSTRLKLSEADQLFEQGQNGARQTSLLPTGWDPALAGDEVMKRLVKVTGPKVKGAHDAEFVFVGERAYIVAEINDSRAGASAGWPPPPPALMKRGVKLFTDRDYVIDEMPDAVTDLPFHRTSIEQTDVEVTKPGTLFALTPTIRPGAASQEEALRRAGFTQVDIPEVQLFPGEINRVSLYRKEVETGDRLKFKKMVLLILAEGANVRQQDPYAPVVIVNPGAEFQDDARPGAMIIGMDRTPKGRLWGCWTGTGDKKDGYFLVATSDDDGTTWSKPRLAVGARTEPEQRISGALVGNLWSDPKGRLWLFFDQQLGDPQKRITNWFIRCNDPDAAEPMWSEPVQFAEGCTLNKPTVLKNGDWLLPVSDWQKKTARVFASTDEGASWKERGSLQFPDWEFDEHMTVELRDGRLWMLARTKGQPHESFSSDGGRTWSQPRQAATVQNINARFFLRRLKSGRILLVKNGSPTERLQKRSHMSAWLSEDDGQTWKGELLLDERNSVSYPDGFESPDGLIHILYDWNRHTDAEILLAKFREEDVLAGRIVSRDAKLLQLANKATGPKPEKLYNGIELPDVWPPRFGDPASVEPTEVPYLKQPPKTLPIDVGRQLFVDDLLIESTDMKRVFQQAEKFPGNPVFKAETTVEKERNGVVYLGQGGVFFDPAEKLFKMFYTAGWRGPLALATSPDLKTWTRPDLGLHGGNIVLPEGAAWGNGEGATAGTDNALWYDINTTDPKERIKYLTCWMHVPKTQQLPGLTHSLQVSDGATWSNPVACNAPAGDYGSIFYNPFRSKWVQSIKRDGPRGRCRYYVESDRFLEGADWSKAVYWTNADRLDRPEPANNYAGNARQGDPPQLYSLAAVAYESLLIGMHQIHRGPRNEICAQGKFPKLTDLELGFSRDGFHWDRPDRRGFIRGAREPGAWDRAYLHTTTGVCVVLDDRLIFPYCAYSGDAGDGRNDMYGGGAIGLATLRRDGFASMQVADKPGTLTTRPVTFVGRHLFMNIHAPQGELRVELLDSSGKVLATSKPISGDTTKQRIEWLDQPDLAKWSGKPVRFRFQLSNGQLYSFWVTEDAGGASNGYVGAGGPDFPSIRDMISSNPR